MIIKSFLFRLNFLNAEYWNLGEKLQKWLDKEYGEGNFDIIEDENIGNHEFNEFERYDYQKKEKENIK